MSGDASKMMNHDSTAEINYQFNGTAAEDNRNSQGKILLTQRRQRQMNSEQQDGNLYDSKLGVQMLETDMNLSDLRITKNTQRTNSKAKKGTNSSTTASETSAKKKAKPAYLQSLNEAEKQANFKIISNMNKKISFLKNPRFKKNQAPILMTDAMRNKIALDPSSIKISTFRVEPASINFVDYQVNSIYEIPLKVTNIASVSKRIKFIPPQTSNFTVKNVNYPSEINGDIAPGMSVSMFIAFSAPSFADFDDVITFVTEESSFKIPMRARRVPPQISLVNPMDCLNSWLGDRVDMAFRCINTGGDGGFKFFCEKDEDDSRQTDADTIRIGSFTLTPTEFYLYSGSAIDVYVSFNPEKEGKLEENLILACDNQTSEFYKLTGYGAIIDLDIIAVDGKQVNFKENPFQTVYFENTNPTSESKRIIRVRNSSPILVPFHWSVYKQKNQQKITLQNEDIHYRIEPAQGKIPGGQYIDFELFFCPQHAEPYFEYADLIIEDIPITAVRDPPQGLKSFAQANAVKNSKVPMPTYIGSNTQFLSIPMIQFNLRGQGNSCKVEVEPAYCQFQGDTFINYEYQQQIKLKKRSEGQVKYTLRLEGKNRSTFEIDVQTQGKSMKSQLNGIINEIIEAEQSEIILNIFVKSTDRGEGVAYFFIEIEDGAPISFQVNCQFIGPIIKCYQPIVDFGLVKVNSHQVYDIQLENTSLIPADILIKSSQNLRLDFTNMISSEQVRKKLSKEQSTASLVYDRPINTKKGNQIQIEYFYLHLNPREKQTLQISLSSFTPETINEFFEVLVKSGASQFLQVRSEVQRPHVSLNRAIINLGRIYAGVAEYINLQSKHQKSSLVIKNYGNLPAHFKWEQKNNSEKCIAKFEPAFGIIQPHSELKIKLSVTFFTGGNLSELFCCDIQDLELPIGFEILADAYGLNVSYETKEDQRNAMSNTQTTIKSKIVKSDQSSANNTLQVLNFPNCTINKTSSQKFILKNLSGIKTSFLFDVSNFAPLQQVAPKEKSELEKAKEQAEERERHKAENGNSNNNSSIGNYKTKKKVGFASQSNQGISTLGGSSENQVMRTRPILSDEHEQTQKFSSAVGETFTKTKQLEKEQGFYLSNNKGIAIVFTPYMGELPPNSEIPITITIYNNVCGKFDDVLVSKVKGLQDVHFPLSISISGSPIRIPPNQVGLNYNTIPPTLPIPTLVTKTKIIQKTFNVKNTGIKGVQMDWQIFDLEKPSLQQVEQIIQIRDFKKYQDQQLQEQSQNNNQKDYFTLDIVKNYAFDKIENPFKFEFQVVEPPPSNDSAFKIEPKQCMVGPRSVCNFTVTFDPSKGSAGIFKSIILASPELSNDEIEIQGQGNSVVSSNNDLLKKGSLGIISLNLDALTINPVLSIDKKLKMDAQHHMRFKYWSVPNEEDAPKKIQKLTFTNDSKADLVFNLNINGPFEIVKTKTNSGATHPLSGQNQLQNQTSTQVSKVSKVLQPKIETMFCLQPLKIVEVHVKFLAPNPNDQNEWPITILNERKGEIIAFFSNGDQSKLFLDGVLSRPKVTILTDFISKNDYALDELDFGQVNVEKNRTIHLYLSNETDVTAKWSLNYVKFPKKTTIGHNTTSPWELENMEKTDDPEVFEFNITSGILKGKSLPLRKVPEGLLVPPVPKNDEEIKYLPQKIFIKFNPKKNVLYKSKFRFLTENGIPCDVILKGRGSYEENHD